MSDSEKPDRPVVELAKSAHQPPKAELDEIIDLGDIEPEGAARALLQPVDVRYVALPNDMRPAPRRPSG